MKNAIFLLASILFFHHLHAQCPAGETEYVIELVADDYPDETTWEVATTSGDVVSNGDIEGGSVCLPAETCHIFTIYDQYGDGICCAFGQGSYTILQNDVQIVTGGEFGSSESVEFNCPSGSSCASPQTIEPGSHTTQYDDHWFDLTPEETGRYSIDLCQGNDCEASVWVYDFCNGLEFDNTELNSIYFSDESCLIEMELQADYSYRIRVGSASDDCAGVPILLSLEYVGAIIGCTDPASCSYNPLATENNPRDCFYLPDPECLQFANQLQLEETLLIERDVATGLDIPWEVLYGPDGHLWVTERKGRVLRINPETGNTNVILDLEAENQIGGGGEPGMLGMVLHPDFENTPLVYIAYCHQQSFPMTERLSAFEWDGENLINEAYLLDGLEAANIHNGARLLITPDNKLLMTRGDVGNSSDAQDMDNLNGKLLRINLDGSVPDDNPFPDSYIYTYGNRNAQGLAFGPDGIIFSTEHGAQSSDEFNIVEAGRNYGWPNVEGECNTAQEENFCNTFDVKEPLAEWTPCPAINDLVYYDHPAIPEWQGKVLVAFLGGIGAGLQRFSVLTLADDFSTVTAEDQYLTNYGRLRDVAVNPHTGAIYIATNGNTYPGTTPNRIIEYRNYSYEPEPVSIPEDINEQQFVMIHPNPMTERGVLVFSENLLGERFQLVSYEGRVVMDKEIAASSMHLNIEALPVGSYFLRVKSNKGSISKTIIVGR